MQNFKRLIIVVLSVFITSYAYSQGTTTAAMNGKVTDPKGETLPGASIILVNTSTGAQYAGITNINGLYNLLNLNVGGPYTITVSFVGYKEYVKSGIYLNLGQTLKLDVEMSETSIELEDVVVVGKKVQDFRVIDGNRTGAETVVGEDQIQMLPTINRDLADYLRLTPQASVDGNGAISIAGINNRYNSISIDGAVNNDVFGLSAQGTNGGQTGGSPISMDVIEQFQVALAPYDVRQSGFAGAGINAVTRSGSNRFEGSAYYHLKNEGLAGRTPTNVNDTLNEKLPDFKSQVYGLRFGGPIIKNKLFFFGSFEIQRDDTPQPFNIVNYTGNSSEADIENLVNHLKTTYGYDPGGYLNNNRTLNSNKLFFRLDWNINTNHKLMVRHSYTNNEALKPYASSRTAINFMNNAEYFPSVTNSTAIELKSNWNKMANDLIIGFTTVRDDRDPSGNNFPSVTIRDGAGRIYFGSEQYSTANQLDQDVWTLTNNFTMNYGIHNITIGTNNEYSSSYNLFIRQNFGSYEYNNLADFINGNSARSYNRSYSLLPNDITGDGAKAAAEFSMLQLGFYAQDELQLTDNFKVTAGLRLDIPMFLGSPDADSHFNDVTIPLIEAQGYDMEGAKAGSMPKSQFLLSPRIGFNWDVLGDQTTQLRGGIGIFTSRLPLVWPGGAYNNNGLALGGVSRSNTGDLIFIPDWDNQYTRADFGLTDPAYGGQVDLFAKDFKFPQVFRVNLAVDRKLPWNMTATLEGMYSKTINNVNYYNLNMVQSTRNLTGGPDDRPIYEGSALVDNSYTYILLATNTSEGYSYNITAQIQKPFDKGLTTGLAYTFGRSMTVNDATSSQNSSQWRYMEQVRGLNDLDLSTSDFDLKHRITGHLSYSIEFLKHLKTSISIYYNGQSGMPYSYVYNDGNFDVNNDRQSDNSLIYIPKTAADINLVDIGTVGNPGYISAAEQWDNLDKFIKSDDYLNSRRGKYAERNSSRSPFENIIDLKFAQDIFTDIAGRQQKLTITLDIFNFTNMLNKDWGARYYVGNNYYTLIDFIGFEADGTTPRFNFRNIDRDDMFSPDDSGVSSSRWQAQIGLRYTF